MLVGKTYQTIRQRQFDNEYMSVLKSSNRIPVPSDHMSKLNSLNNERPLKNNSENLSFKGLSFMGENKSKESNSNRKNSAMYPTLVMLGSIAAAGLALRLAPAYKEVGKYKINDYHEFTDKYLGSMGKDLLDNLKGSKLAKKLVKVEGDNVTVYKKTIPQLIWDGMVYPFKILPGDIANGFVQLMGKIKPLKNWSEKTLQKPFFKNIRQRSKLDAKVNTLRGILQVKDELLPKLAKGEITQEELKSIMFQKKVKMFDPKTGNYDTKHERSLNRIVSGLPPALFLANDAYNLSRMMDDDPKAAESEKKTRFRQELSRIGLNAYITLITMGAIQKYINNSKLGIMLMTAATTLTTESVSRLSNGKHITRLTPEEARKENERINAPEAKIAPVKETPKDINFKAKDDDKNKPHEAPLLSFNTIMKACGIVIAGGFAIKGLRKIKSVDNAFKSAFQPFQDLYNKTTQIHEYTITKQKFNEIIKVLEDNGFNDLAKDYRRVADTAMTKDGLAIQLGSRDKKVKPLVNFVIAPFKFAWNTVKLPYFLADKVVKAFSKSAPKAKKSIQELNVEALAKSIDKIGKEATKKNFNPEKFKTFVKDNTLKAFNVDTMSNVSNSDLSNLAKTAATAATLWFLMTDNYNMVMLKSNGNDKQGAETKFKERFVQEGSRLFYQTLLIDLFNSTFRNQYNASLMGMSWITLTNTTMGEWLTRKSVGVPVGHHTRSELIAEEEKHNNATGALKGYYDFMRRLTGKRSIQSYNVKKVSPLADPALASNKISIDTNQPQQTNINFTNKDMSTLNQMIKKGA